MNEAIDEIMRTVQLKGLITLAQQGSAAKALQLDDDGYLQLSLPGVTSGGALSMAITSPVTGGKIQMEMPGYALLSGATFTGTVTIPGLEMTGNIDMNARNLVQVGTMTSSGGTGVEFTDGIIISAGNLDGQNVAIATGFTSVGADYYYDKSSTGAHFRIIEPGNAILFSPSGVGSLFTLYTGGIGGTGNGVDMLLHSGDSGAGGSDGGDLFLRAGAPNGGTAGVVTLYRTDGTTAIVTLSDTDGIDLFQPIDANGQNISKVGGILGNGTYIGFGGETTSRALTDDGDVVVHGLEVNDTLWMEGSQNHICNGTVYHATITGINTDALHLALGLDAAGACGNLVLCDYANRTADFHHDTPSTSATQWWQSETAPTVDDTQCGAIRRYPTLMTIMSNDRLRLAIGMDSSNWPSDVVDTGILTGVDIVDGNPGPEISAVEGNLKWASLFDFTVAMGNSTKTVGVDAPIDWVEIKIGGVQGFIPVYAA